MLLADALITCFRNCSLWDSFVGCCKKENAVFWNCYTDRRVRPVHVQMTALWVLAMPCFMVATCTMSVQGVSEITSPVQWLSQKLFGDTSGRPKKEA